MFLKIFFTLIHYILILRLIKRYWLLNILNLIKMIFILIYIVFYDFMEEKPN